MHTMVVTMTLDPESPAAVDRHFRQDVVAWARSRPGFVTGRWLRSDDGRKGLGVVTFDSAEAADAAAAGPRSSGPGPAWRIDAVDVFEQVVDA